MIVPSTERAKFFANCRRNQTWSLPDSVIYYVTKNPSTSKCYKKIIQCCKYFFIKKSILVIPDATFRYQDDGWNILFNKNRVLLKNLLSKIWIKDELYIKNYTILTKLPYPLSVLTPRIYQSDIRSLIFYNHTISLLNLKLLASKCYYVRFHHLAVTNSNGLTVELEKIVEVLSNVKSFYYELGYNHQDVVTSNTGKNLIQFPPFLGLKYFTLQKIPEHFDIESFYDYLKKNLRIKIDLFFSDQVSEAYKARLQDIVNEIIAAQNHEYKVPLIHFYGMAHGSFKNLYTLQRSQG